MKAMLLAAGLGERLQPITRAVPKPLLPVLGRPLAPHVLAQLAAEGIEEAVVNLHHRPDVLREALGDGTALGLRRLHYSLEPVTLLGTGGGIGKAAPWLRGSGPVLVRNSDFLADISIADAAASHRRSGCAATLVVAPHRAGYTPVAVDRERRVAGFGAAAFPSSRRDLERFLFTGCHILDEDLLDRLPSDRPADVVRELYAGLAAEGRVNAFVHDGFWWEFGDPSQYLEGSRRLIALSIEARNALGDFDPVRVVRGAATALGPGVDLRGESVSLSGFLVAGLGVSIGEGARLKDTVVMPETWIGPGASLAECIVGPGTEIPAGFVAERAILAADASPTEPPPRGCERQGGLLRRPFAAVAAG